MRRPLPSGWHEAVIPDTERKIRLALVEDHGIPFAAARPVAARLAADRYSEVELGWIYLLEGTLDTVPPAVVERWTRIGVKECARR